MEKTIKDGTAGGEEAVPTAVVKDEPTQVLGKYLQLFDNEQFKWQTCGNSVVDWFGRTVRGSLNIHEFLKFQVCREYQHVNFDTAAECGPIETKPSHRIKKFSTKETDYIHPRNRVVNAPSLKLRAESDGEDHEDEVSGNEASTSALQRTVQRTDGEITPPASTPKESPTRDTDSSLEDDSDDGEYQVRPKKMKRMGMGQFYYLNRWPRRAANANGLLTEEQPVEPDRENYTVHRYLEATGLLRSCEPHTRYDQESTDGCWEREVRLKISYRIHKVTQQTQFLLIIYEHLYPPSPSSASSNVRKSLMAEFNSLADDAGDANEESQTNSAGDTELDPLSTSLIDDGTLGSLGDVSSELEVSTSIDNIADEVIPQLRTPTKSLCTPPSTPKRRQRLPGPKRYHLPTPGSAPKRANVARSLRL